VNVKLPGLKRERERRLILQKELASQSGTPAQTISRIENGRPARLETARRIAQALDVSLDELLRSN
jgi:transcriptional regulator with XRE-family HTH domain